MNKITQGEIIAKWQEICEQPDTYGEGVISAVRLARWIEQQTAPDLAAEVERLRAENGHFRTALTNVECAYCESTFTANDPLQFEHWRECAMHPAKIELDNLRAQVETMREALEMALEAEKSAGRLPHAWHQYARAALGSEP